MYIVLKNFSDKFDKHSYRVGDSFPHTDSVVLEFKPERIAALVDDGWIEVVSDVADESKYVHNLVDGKLSIDGELRELEDVSNNILKEYLDEREIKYSSKATKPDFIELIVTHEGQVRHVDTDEILLNVKEDLNIDDTEQDTILNRLIEKVINHFTFKYKSNPTPHHWFIIEDCVIKRYNRRKAEGATSISVEGHSVTYEDKYEFSEWDKVLKEEFGLVEGSFRERGGAFFR